VSRFEVYARAHGRSDADQLAHDRQAFPGGRMCGFILWTGAQWRAWCATVGRKNKEHLTQEEHAAFDAWLDKSN
jgi:hypothetical protein